MRSWISGQRTQLDSYEQFVLVVVALFPFAWLPVFLFDTAPRVALALCLLPLGGLILFRDSRRRDTAALLALGFVLAASLASLLSPARLHSLFGTPDWWLGTLGLATALAWWAVGRDLGPPAREVLVPALVAGALWNGTVALAQVVLEPDTEVLAAMSGRGSGTMLNPTYYGAFMSGVLACWMMRLSRSWRSDLVSLALAIGVGLSGGRIAAAVVVGLALVGFAFRGRRQAAARNLVMTVVGLLVASAIASAGTAPTLVQRTASSGGGSVRFALWRKAVSGWLERPWFGWGPGNIELATERQFDAEYTSAQMTADGTLVRWLDTHNVVLNLLVGVGLVGLALAVGIVVVSLRGLGDVVRSEVDRPLLAGCVAMAANWLLQSSTLHTVPLALLLFGAATHRSRRGAVASIEGSRPVEGGRVAGAACYVGVALGVALLTNLFLLNRSIENQDMASAERLVRLGYRDPWVYDAMSEAYLLLILDRDREEMLEASGTFASRSAAGYPSHAAMSKIGAVALAQGDLQASLDAELAALEVQPWNPTSHRRIVFLAMDLGDQASYQSSLEALCRIGHEGCEPSPSAGEISDHSG